MKARQLIRCASYGPDEVKALGKAFDDAWARLAPSVGDRTEAIEAARFKLAEVVLGLARRGDFDPQGLADAAVQVMQAPSQKPKS